MFDPLHIDIEHGKSKISLGSNVNPIFLVIFFKKSKSFVVGEMLDV